MLWGHTFICSELLCILVGKFVYIPHQESKLIEICDLFPKNMLNSPVVSSIFKKNKNDLHWISLFSDHLL